MRTKTGRYFTAEKGGPPGIRHVRRSSKRLLQGVLIAFFLTGSVCVLFDKLPLHGKMRSFINAGVPQSYDELSRSFALDDEDVYQVLQALGSERMIVELESLKLNCDSWVIDERVDGSDVLLDVKLRCECSDPEAGNTIEHVFLGEMRFLTVYNCTGSCFLSKQGCEGWSCVLKEEESTIGISHVDPVEHRQESVRFVRRLEPAGFFRVTGIIHVEDRHSTAGGCDECECT